MFKTLVIKNPTFIFISVALSIQSFIITGTSAFNAKIALFQYQLTVSQVSAYAGISGGTGAILGNLAGKQLRFIE